MLAAVEMTRIEAGRFTMGSDRPYAEEGPAHSVVADPFWIDDTPVTNHQPQKLVAATGHLRLAEIPPDPAAYPGVPETIVKHAGLRHAFRSPWTRRSPTGASGA